MNNRATRQQIEAARRLYQNDNVEIDHDADESRGVEPGAWVQAWVWVPDSEVTEPEEEGEFD